MLPNHSLSVQMPANSEKPTTTTPTTMTVRRSGAAPRRRGPTAAAGRPGPPPSGVPGCSEKKSLIVTHRVGGPSGIGFQGGVKQL